MDGQTSWMVHEGNREVRQYNHAFTSVQSQALAASDSIELIANFDREATHMRTPASSARVALAYTPYRKSSRSSGTGNCVMMGSTGSWVGIQDSKEHPDSTRRTTLATPHLQWAGFLHAVTNNQLHP